MAQCVGSNDGGIVRRQLTNYAGQTTQANTDTCPGHNRLTAHTTPTIMYTRGFYKKIYKGENNSESNLFII